MDMTLLSMPKRLIAPVAAMLLCLSLAACGGPEYARELPPGTFSLRKIEDPEKQPDLQPLANQLDDPAWRQALVRSVQWFANPSTRTHFPVGDTISHGHAWASVYALQQIARNANSSEEARRRIASEFDIWQSIGWDGQGTVLYTGYYSPVFEASREKTDRFQHPLYKRPDDLVTKPRTGEVVGRKTESGVEPYPTRRQIKERNLLEGLELVYLPSRFDAYLVEINGSAKLEMRDGSIMHVGYDGNNGHDYTSVGELLVQDGKLDENVVTLPKIVQYFENHPEDLDHYISKNDRFVFFKEYSGQNWPTGSLGFEVTPMRTLATDKSIFPRACPVFVQTTIPNRTGSGEETFNQLMLDQDTGGAIRAAGRADIYVGVGKSARSLAGHIASEGQMYYLLLKRDRAEVWFDRLRKDDEIGAQPN